MQVGFYSPLHNSRIREYRDVSSLSVSPHAFLFDGRVDCLHICYHDKVPWVTDAHKIEFGSAKLYGCDDISEMTGKHHTSTRVSDTVNPFIFLCPLFCKIHEYKICKIKMAAKINSTFQNLHFIF